MHNLRRGVASLLFFVAVTAVAGPGCSEHDEGLLDGPLGSLGSSARVNSGIKTRMRFTVRHQEEWAELWTKVHQSDVEPPLPDVEFERQLVIVAAMGETPNSLYETRIESATIEGGAASVTVRERTPAQGCIVQPATATPLDMYVTLRFEDEPTYVETESLVICN